jgi:hypothetical protein
MSDSDLLIKISAVQIESALDKTMLPEDYNITVRYVLQNLLD